MDKAIPTYDNLTVKLSKIQNELKAPKNQYNSFGKYNYRSCEDILEALKPICAKHRTTLILNDSVQMIGDRFYIKATATLLDWDSIDIIEGVAYARESITKKGMDDSQVTGATSSYARKYALNGLFNIDDTKDFDTDESHKIQQAKPQTKPQTKPQAKATSNEKDVLVKEIKEFYTSHKGFAKVIKSYTDQRKVENVSDLEINDLREMVELARVSANSFK